MPEITWDHSIGTFHLSEEAPEPQPPENQPGATDPLHYACELHTNLYLLFWKTTKVRPGRFRPRQWASASGHTFAYSKKQTNKQTKTEYLHFQEKADMWPLFSSNIWAMHLKLSDTLCVQNVRQIAVIQGKHLGLRPGNNQTHLKAAGEKYCSSPWVMMMPQISRGSYKRQTWTLNTSQEWGVGQITEEGFVNQQSPLTILWEIKIESE